MLDELKFDGRFPLDIGEPSISVGNNGVAIIVSFGEIEVVGYGKPLEARFAPALTDFRLTIAN